MIDSSLPPTSIDEDLAVISINNLGFRWSRRLPEVLALEYLRIAPGERVFIEGPSGSGKSTLLSLLAAMTAANRGSVQVLGERLEKLAGVQRDHFRADHIGFIFQMFNLIPYLSVIENVILPCRFSNRRRNQALQYSPDLNTEALRLLQHLDMADSGLLHRPVTALSVGQQQRVAAARALIGSPEILIADEPTTALDTHRREGFVRLLFDECARTGATLVFVSHDASLEGLFDRTIRLAEINPTPTDSAQVAQRQV